jgi:hypothetical protein
MGYRSNVVIVIKYDLIPDDKLSFLINECDAEVVFDAGYCKFSMSDIKWYDQDIECWLNELDRDEWKFVRTAEDATDIEETGSCEHFNVHASVSIYEDEIGETFNQEENYPEIKELLFKGSKEEVFNRMKRLKACSSS